jgi:hypothetical protein
MNFDDESFLNFYLQNKKEIIVTIADNSYCELIENWFESLKKIKCYDFSLAVALDEKCFNFLKQKNLPVVKSIFNVNESINMKDWREKEKKIQATDILNISKKYKIDIIHSEVDIIFLKNPLEKIKKEILPDYDMCVLSDRRFNDFYTRRDIGIDAHIDRNSGIIHKYGKSYWKQYGIQNFAFSYMPYNENNVKFWDRIIQDQEYKKKFDVEGHAGLNQTLLINAIKDFGIKVKTLSPFEFANGTVWDISYLREKIKDSCYLIHYNTAEGKTPYESKTMKIAKMRMHDHWYID